MSMTNTAIYTYLTDEYRLSGSSEIRTGDDGSLEVFSLNQNTLKIQWIRVGTAADIETEIRGRIEYMQDLLNSN